jgi:membrane-bound serine protease (ClpP class)
MALSSAEITKGNSCMFRFRRFHLFVWLLLIGVGLLSLFTPAVSASVADGGIVVLTVDGTINPVVAGYIGRGIGLAEERDAIACIIRMDTPGGLDSSMRDIVQSIMESDVPVVVYVPPGSRAASAGAFITLSAHVAAMAPGTEIGAAHPVAIGGDGMDETMEEKVVNDAVAYIRSIAEARDRNADWAEEAVRESRSSPSSEALGLEVIDIIADDIDDLIVQLNGLQVTLLDGEEAIIQTDGAAIEYIDMSALERFLFTITDPNIAYILLSIGMLGITLELFNPGTIVPGVVGGICLLLSFYSLGVLPVNYAGLLLVLLGFGLFVAEVFTTSNGVLSAGGIAAFAIGSIILMSNPAFHINRGLIAGVAVVFAAFFIFVIASIVRTNRRKQQTGRDAMVGMVAVARTPLDPGGTVFVHGELWQATLDEGNAEAGEEVTVTKIDGLHLTVTKETGGE